MLDKAGQFLKEPQDPGMKGLYKFIRAGWLLRNNPNSEEGMKLMKEFMTGDRMKVYPGYLLARAMIQSKRPLAAKDAIEEALRKNPSHPVLKAMLAGLTTVPELPKKPDAQPDGGTAGDGGAPDAGAVEQKAPAEKAAEKPAEKVAEKAVEKAADKAPPAAQKPDQPSGNLENLLKRGRRLRETGRAKQAVEYFEKAADLDPARAEPHTGLGWCYVEQEKFDQAIAEFQKALGLKGSRCESLSGLGETFRYKKNKTEAIRYYQMYLQECPNGPDAPVARNNINNLR
jgi:tetratricopeptide (TPR) repeat protein